MRYLKAKREKGEIKEDEFNKEKKEIENEQPGKPFTYQGGFQGPPKFRQQWQEGGPHFGFGRHRRGMGGHGPHFGGHGPHFGMHGPHFGMHGPLFGMHGPNAYPPYPYQGQFNNYEPRMVNDIIKEEGNPNSNTNFQ